MLNDWKSARGKWQTNFKTIRTLQPWCRRRGTKHKGPGRPSTAAEVKELVIGLAEENRGVPWTITLLNAGIDTNSVESTAVSSITMDFLPPTIYLIAQHRHSWNVHRGAVQLQFDDGWERVMRGGEVDNDFACACFRLDCA